MREVETKEGKSMEMEELRGRLERKESTVSALLYITYRHDDKRERCWK
jgi:hypothetical protein